MRENGLIENKQAEVAAEYYKGVPVAQIAIKRCVSRSTIYAWIRNQKAENMIKTVPTQKEVINLNQKIAKLQDIISVLKQVDCTVSAPLQVRLLARESFMGSTVFMYFTMHST